MNQPPDETPGETTATATQTWTRLKAGDTLADRFVIVQFLAHGGMGEVYEAADLHLQGQHHALKTLRPDVAGKPGFRERFEREVLLARDVNHPNVCPTYDLFQVEDASGPLTFLTMKLLKGESLQTRIRRLGRLSHDDVAVIAKQMAGALDAAHQRGVVHRDFKPGNVMLETSGSQVHAWITDFGLSRASTSDATLAQSGAILGTPGYIAPEVLRGEVASFQADVYAFGVVLHTMLTGRRPVRDGAGFTPPSRLTPDVPVIWDRVVLGCLEPLPERRFASAGAALAALDGERASSGRASTGRARSTKRAWIAAASLAAVSIAGAWFGRTWVDALLHPLPEKRFVALMGWPPDAEGANNAVVNRTTEAIGSRLARAEATTHDLLVISSGDVAGQPALKSPSDAAAVLGANLVLGIAVAAERDGLRLTLSLLDAASTTEIRRRSQFIAASSLGRIEDAASALAADLLDVRLPSEKWKDQDELATVPAAVFRQFTAAEDLARQPNDTGLDAAIEGYQRVVEAAPSFALGYGRLSLAYSRKYASNKDAAALALAQRNADVALRLNKDSVNAVLSRAMVDLYSGRTDAALDALQRALDLDPGNPQILLAKARAFRARNRIKDEELVYREIIKSRPNFWPAYDQLGLNLYRQADYRQASEALQEGLVIAPRIVRMLNNLGAMQLSLKQRTEAADTFRRSVAVTPTATAYQNLGTLAFQVHDYTQALANYLKAADLAPKDDVVWRNIGDAYALLRDQPHVMESYAKAATAVTDSLQTNPKRSDAWMSLALYEAKLGHRTAAEEALRHAEELNANSMPALFKKAQTLALLGRRAEALNLLIECIQKGQSLEDVELAVDLADLRHDPRYLEAAATVQKGPDKR